MPQPGRNSATVPAPIYGQVDPGTKDDCSSVTDPEGAFGKTLVN